MKVLLPVASCLLISFVWATLPYKLGHELLDGAHFGDTVSPQSFHPAAISSQIGPKNGVLLPDEATPKVLSPFNVHNPSSLPHSSAHTALELAPGPAVENLVSRLPKKGLLNKNDAFSRIIKKILLRLGIRKDTFSERYLNGKIQYFDINIKTTRGTEKFGKMSENDLSAAHKEIAGLGEFYRRITLETDPVAKANIFQTSMDAFKNVPTTQIKQSDLVAWLQTIANIMELGKTQERSNVVMEAAAQHGLLDLMTKFDGAVDSTRQYYQSVHSLQLLLKKRFSLTRSAPGLKKEAYNIPWAIEVLYSDQRIDLNYDLKRYVEWLQADKTLAETIQRLAVSRSEFVRQDLMSKVAKRALRSNQDTSSQDKCAATIFLSVLGYIKLKDSKLFAHIPTPKNTKALSDMESQARIAMLVDFPHPNFEDLFPNNAQRAQQFRDIYDFPQYLLNKEDFEKVTINSGGVKIQYNKMKDARLEAAISQDVELYQLFHSRTSQDVTKSRLLQNYMDQLNSQLMSMPLPKFVTSIQTVAAFMKVISKEPCDISTERIAITELDKILEKLSKTEVQTHDFYAAAHDLRQFLKGRSNFKVSENAAKTLTGQQRGRTK